MADREVLMTPYARLSFPNLGKPRAFRNGDAKYGAAFLVPKPENIGKNREDGKPFSPWGKADRHSLSKLEAAVAEIVKGEYGANPPKKLKLPFKDGDEENWDGYEGHLFIRTTSVRPPKLIDAQRNEITGADIEKMFYAGCWVRAAVNPFTYDNSGNKGVSFGLQLVQFIRNDAPFSGSVRIDQIDELPEDDIAPDDLDDIS